MSRLAARLRLGPLALAASLSLVAVGCSSEAKTADKPAAVAPSSWLKLGADDDVMAKLDAALARAREQKQPALVDFWADWCVPCKEMDKTVFPDTTVQQALSGYTLIKVDITADTEGLRAAQKRYSVTSMPTLLFFGPNGDLLDDLRVTEKVDTPALLARLQKVPAS